ncbi:wax ester/triacylglycerol synthase family O-acyltransferase [Nocardioides daphniae]|uniref:Diacylglycerol O-acyltransferase n=1 Tax=Nocardioides daphniae TaxID=402297 RepID=A0A4P7UDR9_9ACTN|nr:wax ester/triacylglycerol synthase family O-acyltransferase [Nocardioides daphniae]QCC78432.1 wax ester/triacylglycerol synthase family O-acyltransferase [Nocardioides daphniae]GGD12477.1 diacylglycerol O-acyltransferase [Nocardioides daphniae]
MHRLNGEDAGFLHMDLPGQPMNSMVIGVLAGEHATLTLAELRAHLDSRLDELPSWRWRIVGVPGDLQPPVAVRDPDFDLGAHVREVTVSGGPAELEAWFASLAEEHLPTDRPLWQVWLVTGLDDGSQAVALKFHHALADGAGAMTTIARVFSDLPFDPLPPVPGHDGRPFRAERVPGRLRLLVGAVVTMLVMLLRVPWLVVRTVRAVRRVRSERLGSGVDVPQPSAGAPRTALNSLGSPHRAYVRASLDLADLKAVKTAAGVTLNDVVLAVVAGACERHLASRGGVPERPLLASVPMAAEAPGAPVRQFGNRFWSFTTSLATDVADPWERLQQISTVSAAAKRRLELLGVDLVADWLDVLPPFLAKQAIRGTLERMADPEQDVDASILVSNVRGPAEPYSLGGRVFGDLHIDGPPSNGVGCNVMVWSYGQRMLLGVLAYADVLDDPQEFRAALTDSCAELVELARERTGRPAA